MKESNSTDSYQQRKARLAAAVAAYGGCFRLRKRTTSNLFRYTGRRKSEAGSIWLGDFNHVLSLDTQARTLDVEALITYDELVRFTLPRGFLPTVAPELKHITLGGAIVGIGIESSCFRYGFVHDGISEADVLLTDGRIVTCRADNEHADLFFGLPNSYGTLGYVLRATIDLIPARPFVRVANSRFCSIEAYLDAMEEAATDAQADFVEGLFFSDDELYLTTGSMVDEASETKDIYRENIYYKLLRRDDVFFLDTHDYIFRYDPDWFWNIPEGGVYDLFRRFAPRSLRTSAFYSRYVAATNRLRGLFASHRQQDEEQLIQDWEIPWPHAEQFLRYALSNVDIQGQPWVAAPICSPRTPTLYPVQPNTLYLNVGCYCFAKKPRPDVDFHYTRLLDRKCCELEGIKMLYSSTFLMSEEFDALYNGQAYAALKGKYDPQARAPTLFEKVARSF